MRVLILSCNTGQGHNSVSFALKEYFEEQNITCHIKDALGFLSKRISDTISKGHSLVYCYTPSVFSFGYGFADTHRKVLEKDSTAYKLLSLNAERLYKFCLDGEYDIIICTHVFSALMITNVKNKFPLRAITSFVATDYTCSPGTEISNLDYYFIPDESLSGEFTKYGIPLHKIYPSGIPIRKKFFVETSKEQAKAYLGIEKDHKHILIMCGSMGCGPIKKIAKNLSQTLSKKQELTIVCGKNKKLLKELSKTYNACENIRIIGYTNNIPLLMDSADLYITKPGGISVTEASIKSLPMVFINAVAGCEEYNMQYYIQRGCGVTAGNIDDLTNLCINLISSNASLNPMKKSIEKINKQNPSEYIFNHLNNNIFVGSKK